MNIHNPDGAGLLTVSQVTAMTGVSKSTLRHWEREFRDYLETARVEENGRRMFRADALQKIEKIKNLVHEQGLTLRGVRTQLEQAVLEREESRSPPDRSEERARQLADLVAEHIVRRIYADNSESPLRE
ncbi:MAG: MerR family transcriptional regulator [Calditrichaeota bacterium]|nr:MerR family transcriptional regulator [Calditrichota bacterium]